MSTARDSVASPLATNIDEEWDAFVAQQPDGHHEQSSGYGQNRREYGYEVKRVLVRERGVVVGGAQMLIKKSALGRAAHVLRAPLARNGDETIIRRVVREMTELAEEKGCYVVRVDTFPDQVHAVEALDESGYSPSELSSDRWPSLVIPVQMADDELLGQMHYNVRRYVRKLRRRHDVDVKVGDYASLLDFYELHRMSAEHQGFKVFPFEYFAYLWRNLGARGHMQHFVAYHGGRPVAGIMNTVVGRTMYYGWGGIHRGTDERRLHANLLLHLAAVRFARELGCTVYDLCGTQRFKRQLGISEIEWPMPRFRYFGSTAAVRRQFSALVRSKSRAGRTIRRIGQRLGVVRPMPY